MPWISSNKNLLNPDIPIFFQMLKPIVVMIAFLGITQVSGQVITPDTYNNYKWDFDRLVDGDSSEIMLHYTIHDIPDDHFHWLDPSMKTSVNTGYARGFNDGAVWKGKGLNTELHAGFQGKIGILSYTFQPVVYFAQNLAYPLDTVSSTANKYNYQYGKIDFVQRYGDKPIVAFYPGQSEIKVAKHGVKIAVGTQNFTYGGGVYNPIIMSNNAPGMLNVNIGTDGAVNLGYKKFQAGKFEMNIAQGLMKESQYFDNNSKNNLRYFSSLFVAYSPSFAPGLSLGFNKVMYKQTRYFEGSDLYATLFNKDSSTRIVNGDTLNAGNDFFDQMASLSVEWKFPSLGFRAYGEFARNDFNGDLRRFLVEPEHSRAYLIGFQKLFKTDKGEVVFNYEHVNLSVNHTTYYRASPTYYEHSVNTQGYTNLGQVMGAGIGPGSNADNLEIKIKQSSWLFGFQLQRIEYNKDYFVKHNPSYNTHDIEYTIAGKIYKDLKHLVIGAEYAYSYNYNRYYIYKNDVSNVYLALSAQLKLEK